jgi:hypothetical protein
VDTIDDSLSTGGGSEVSLHEERGVAIARSPRARGYGNLRPARHEALHHCRTKTLGTARNQCPLTRELVANYGKRIITHPSRYTHTWNLWASLNFERLG